MRKLLIILQYYVWYIPILLFIIIPLDSRSQINAVSWIGYNSYTDVFPIPAAAVSPAMISSANMRFRGLFKSNDQGSVWMNKNSKRKLDINTAPYLSFSLDLLTTNISFDKFVIPALSFENHTTISQLRWSIDGFNTSLGEFTVAPDARYTLTSVDLSSLPPITKKQVEFRIYFYNGIGNISHSDSGRYISLDGTASSYAQPGIASIWVKNAVVPPTIEQFRAKLDNDYVQLKWHTSSEENISHFEIERSLDGVTYFNVGRVTALGIPTEINKYHFTDRSLTDGTAKVVFYRLWMLDNNGNARYTRTVPVVIKKDEAIAFLFPNPVKNTASVVISGTKQENIRYSVTDSKSNMIQTGRYALQQGSNILNINVSNFSNGKYTLNLQGSYTNSSLQFVK